ncbi:MAG: hypothetical protein QGG40_17960 [Myxococcota bacterium]|nr:hypothetical protein [Myxococcota bacterium]
MQQVGIDSSQSSRNLRRLLRSQPHPRNACDSGLPESLLWQVWCELRRRGEQDATNQFLRSVRTLHRRRTHGGADLSTQDVYPNDYKLVDDPFVGEIWKAYKKCICNQRTGPAAQLLRDLETQILPA